RTLEVFDLNANLQKMRLYGPDITMGIERMSFRHHRGLEVRDLVADFSYTRKNISLKNLDLETANSTFKGDVVLDYIREDFKDFNNKVRFDVRADEASIATDDIHYFYAELGQGRQFEFKSRLQGTLNDFTAKSLDLGIGESKI